jgi:perosamine synthetase
VPVPVEPDPLTLNIDISKIEAAITSKTKAIMVVHLYGLACEMKSVVKLAEQVVVKMLEDNKGMKVIH